MAKEMMRMDPPEAPKTVLMCLEVLKQATSESLKRLKAIYIQYQSTVLEENSELAATIESTLQMFAFWVPGRLSSSELASETIHTVFRMLSGLHRYVRRKITRQSDDDDCRSSSAIHKSENLRFLLSVLDYIGTLLELTSEIVWGDIGKLLLVLSLQFAKVLLRLFLLQTGNTNMILYSHEGYSPDSLKEPCSKEANTHKNWQGKRSGRVFRCISSNRINAWQNPHRVVELTNRNESDESFKEQGIPHAGKIAEIMYAIRPVIHLVTQCWHGEHSWKPWVTSVLLEICCLLVTSKNYMCERNSVQMEQRWRATALLLYLLRNPFYQVFTKHGLCKLGKLAQSIPLVSTLVDPLHDYLLMWQRLYTYCWSSL